MDDGIYATFHTSKGEMVTRLFFDKVPLTVANFVGLAEGTRQWRGRSGDAESGPFYDGLTFHRVIADFMIQGGCPDGTGAGSPGYRFRDEFHPELKHDRAGILSMANAGPGTNGSQFFITHVPTDWLDGKHAVFGELVEGEKVLYAIQGGDVLEKVTITRVGAEAEAFDAEAVFSAG